MFIIYIETLIYLIQKMTLKKVIDKISDLNSKRSESFNKKQVNRSVNLVINKN